jgi:hypothetical protein
LNMSVCESGFSALEPLSTLFHTLSDQPSILQSATHPPESIKCFLCHQELNTVPELPPVRHF